MKKYALIFPGQGAQKQGMGSDLYENSAAARKVFDTASEVLGYDIANLCFNGSEEDLMKTVNSQPAILTVSLAAFEALKKKINIKFECCAGHSLGEYAALYAANAVDLKSVLKLIQKRAFLMNEAAEKTSGAMAAIIGLDNDTVINITKELKNVYAANFNSPVQVVITGGKEEINSSIEKFKSAGAKKVIPLAVSGAFHSPYMSEAAKEFLNYTQQFVFANSTVPVYTNVDAKASTAGSALKDKLPKQICSSVMWVQTINNMINDGVTDFMEIGPSKVLAGLNKKIAPEINTINIYDYSTLISAVSEIKEKELV